MNLILTILGGDETQLPSHVVQKVKARITAALKKNAAMDADRYSSLAGMLEYFDLREVEDTLLTNSLWQRFQGIFCEQGNADEEIRPAC